MSVAQSSVVDTTGVSTDTTTMIAKSVVLAPMVRGSEAAFRTLMRSIYPNLLCYSPMIRARSVIEALKDDYNPRNHHHEDTQLVLHDLPHDDQAKGQLLVVQLCGSSPTELYSATRAILGRHSIAGIDLNLGCPQSCARDAQFGAYLAEQAPDVALECVRSMRRAMDHTRSSEGNGGSVALSCKIRLHDTFEKTLAFAKSLQDVGVDRIAVHCRKRGAKFDGEADLVSGKRLVEALTIPVWINGARIEGIDDVERVLRETGAPRVMVARDFLANPRVLVSDCSETAGLCNDAKAASVAAEYLDFAAKHPPPTHEYLQLHFKWMFRHVLQPPKGQDDYTNWRHRLWNFLRRPYLQHLEQYRYIVALFVHQAKCVGPASSFLSDIPTAPTYNMIRHLQNTPPRSGVNKQHDATEQGQEADASSKKRKLTGFQ